MAEIEPDFPIFVGRCIYCRASDGRLSDEHIIPYALNGEWILQKASCEACAKATSRLELELLRGDLLPLRTRLGLRTRRKHERPRALPFKYKRGDAMMLTELPVDEHPAPIALPIFRLPGHFAPERADRDELLVRKIGTLKPPDEAFARVVELGATDYTVRWPEPDTFARFLAKVGYAFAVGCIGLDAIPTPYVVDAILSRDVPVGRWVGSPDTNEVNGADGFHSVVLHQRQDDLVAYVRLFAEFGVREYIVVVGPAPVEDAAKPSSLAD
jgi:hypothetical protein